MTIAKPCLPPSTSPFESQSSSPPPNSNPNSNGNLLETFVSTDGSNRLTLESSDSVLELATDSELFELENILFGPRKFWIKLNGTFDPELLSVLLEVVKDIELFELEGILFGQEDFKISLIFNVTNLTPYLPPGASPTATEPLEVEFSGSEKELMKKETKLMRKETELFLAAETVWGLWLVGVLC
ncbi:hypothetical protein FEM48_Zijuj05G0170700 [Ziziphus jujuba var. spinosa]|uniref:Uncharacterized protein n=1 Tax=Ziziphus jujuba var. spinosa TaxID=714518 RepID=A0A978VG19_ZIZJJ|nr:hypothetical protein FEM48_Zijuj05G0170700 [Ziziphus jujuba var. spinosa]